MRIISNKTLSGHGRVPAVREYRIVGLKTSATDPKETLTRRQSECMSTNEIMVFFYGLFMDESLLASKGVRPTEPTIGYVDGYGLRIGKRATLLPEANSRAYGVLMKIASEDAAALYSEQSVADYIAEPVVVTLPGDIHVSAVCYNLPTAKLVGTNPEYAAALLALATKLGLPDSYLRHIRNAV